MLLALHPFRRLYHLYLQLFSFLPSARLAMMVTVFDCLARQRPPAFVISDIDRQGLWRPNVSLYNRLTGPGF